MSVRQALRTLRRPWTTRPGPSIQRVYSTEIEQNLDLSQDLSEEQLEQLRQHGITDDVVQSLTQNDIPDQYPEDLAPPPIPDGMANVLKMKEKRTRFDFLKKSFEGLGSTQNASNTWKPYHELHRPAHPSELTLTALVASGAHFGHSKSLLNPNFMPYAYGTRAGITLINLDMTLPLLRRAAALVRAVAMRDGTVLFVGTRPDLRTVTRVAAERMGENAYHLSERWFPGTLTNRVHLFGPNTSLSHRIIPDLVIFLNPIQNLHAIRECAVSHVPTMAIIDSNVDPRIVMYPIPANDESPRVAELIAGVLSVAGQEGNAIRHAAEERHAESGVDEKFRKASDKAALKHA